VLGAFLVHAGGAGVLSPCGGRDDTPMGGFFRWGSIGAVALLLLGPSAAWAQGLRPLQPGRFTLDLFQGPLLAPIGITGMAGAYAGYAEGIQGMVANAAAPAVREPTSFSNFEFDGSGSISIPISLFSNSDFDNSGSIDFDYSNFLYGTLGGVLQYGPTGAGFTVELQRYTLTDNRDETTNVLVGKAHVLGGFRLFGDQLTVGGGARFLTMGIDAPRGTFTMIGAAPEFGFLIRPDWQSFRIGATMRLPVHGNAVPVLNNGGPTGLILPGQVVQPWELEAGFAVQIGPRPLNPEWQDPTRQEAEVVAAYEQRKKDRAARNAAELGKIRSPGERAKRSAELAREEAIAVTRDFRDQWRALGALKAERRARYWNWPREHLLLTAELLVTGAVGDGVSIQRFLGQNQANSDPTLPVVGSSGAAVNFSPRFGVETEPVPDLVHTKFGTYYEPSRFGGVGRQHFTFGADLKLFKTTWFGLVPEVIYKIQASADLAPRYQSLSLGAGVWH
jgi:hypothetical protein